MAKARARYDSCELGLAEGRADVQEDARFVLPNAAETRIVVTMNARELRHFFKVRCCLARSGRSATLAWRMRTMLRAVSPNLFEGTGPRCLYGDCGEGKMTCGIPYKSEDVDTPVTAVG